MVQPRRKTVWRFLKKLQLDRPYDLAILLSSRICLKKMETPAPKDPCIISVFITALFTIAKIWKQLKCPSSDEWIKKMWHTHT